MKYTKFIFLFLFGSSATSLLGQYSFTPEIHVDGANECRDAANMAQSMLRGYQVSGIPTRSQCEQIRATISSIKVNSYGCKIYYTCTPCVGTELYSPNTSIPNNNSNPFESNLTGTPVNNVGVEIRNAIQDYDYQKEQLLTDINSSILIKTNVGDINYANALNQVLIHDSESSSSDLTKLKQFIPTVESSIKDWAKEYVSSMIDKSIENEYTYESNLNILLPNKFKELTGIDVNELINKAFLSTEEFEILNRYNEFVDLACNEILALTANKPCPVIEYEMAAYALGVYKDDGERFAADVVNVHPLRDLSQISDPLERNAANSILDYITQHEDSWGFNSDIYYDPAQDKYIISLRGTELNSTGNITKDAIIADGLFALAANSPQHTYARELGELIKNSGIPLEKITITGHSLGGALATIVGLTSGCETYAYNPAHISKLAASQYNLDLTKQEHIHNYIAEGEGVIKYAEGAAKLVQKVNPVTDTVNKITGNVEFLTIGEQNKVTYIEKSFGNHSQEVMLKSLEFENRGPISKWQESRALAKKTKSDIANESYKRKPSSLNYISTGKVSDKNQPQSSIFINASGINIERIK